MRCTVCQQLAGSVGSQGWSLTTERTPCSQLQIIFKLFHITSLEFEAGAICPLCHELVVQIDTLEDRLRNLAERASDNVCDDFCLKPINQSIEPTSTIANRVADVDEGLKDAHRSSGDRANKAAIKREASLRDDAPENGGTSAEDPVATDVHLEEERSAELDQVLDYMEPREEECESNNESDEEYGASTLRRGKGRRNGTSNAGAMQPKLAKANFSPENLDYDVMLSKTSRGKDMLVYKRHVYHGETRRGHSGYTNIFKWKCSVKHRFKGCKGRLTSTIDGSCVLKDSVVEHCHKPPHGNLTKRHQFKDYVRDLALNDPEMKPSDVIRNAQLLSSEDPETIGFSLKAITSFVQKVRRRSNYGDNNVLVSDTISNPEHGVIT